jgi:hypothetical protein
VTEKRPSPHIPSGRSPRIDESMAKTRKNTGLTYELVVQGIFQAIHNEKAATTIVVERNKILQGRISPHQIDVYWKFELAGIAYETIVQAKDWKNRVKLGQLLEFKGVLDDLPGQPRGIFVTRTGYQKGAKDYAAAHGILLYELAEPPRRPNTQITRLDWFICKPEFRTFRVPSKNTDEGLIDEVAMGLKMTVFHPIISTFAWKLDSPWFDKNLADTGLDKSQIKFNPIPDEQVILYDETHAPVSNLDAIIRQELSIVKEEKLDRKHVERVFDSGTFIGPPYTNDVFIKITKLSFDLEIRVKEIPADFTLARFAKFVLREIPSNKTRTFIAPKAD